MRKKKESPFRRAENLNMHAYRLKHNKTSRFRLIKRISQYTESNSKVIH